MKIWEALVNFKNRRIVNSDPVFAKFAELSKSKESQYEVEARQIIVEGELSKNISGYVIVYSIKDGQPGFEIFDPSQDNELIAGNYGPNVENDKDMLFYLKSNLAQSEAMALSYAGEI
jgi:hypothetical protein